MTDGRKRPRMDPPFDRGCKPVTVILSPADYRALYEITLRLGTSMAEALRLIIRADHRAHGGDT